MKLSLDTIGYGGYFTAIGERLPLDDDGLLSAEQCSPIIVKGHKLGTIETVDERYVESLTYMRGLLDKIAAYTGHKSLPATAHDRNR